MKQAETLKIVAFSSIVIGMWSFVHVSPTTTRGVANIMYVAAVAQGAKEREAQLIIADQLIQLNHSLVIPVLCMYD